MLIFIVVWAEAPAAKLMAMDIARKSLPSFMGSLLWVKADRAAIRVERRRDYGGATPQGL
jgi:hypothetical protein